MMGLYRYSNNSRVGEHEQEKGQSQTEGQLEEAEMEGKIIMAHAGAPSCPKLSRKIPLKVLFLFLMTGKKVL